MEFDEDDEMTEKVFLEKYDHTHDPKAGTRGRAEAYDDDDEDEESYGMHGHGGPGVQCATQ